MTAKPTTLADLDEVIEADARRDADRFDLAMMRAKSAAENARYAANPDLTEASSNQDAEDEDDEA